MTDPLRRAQVIVFIAGLILWFDVQVCWLSGSFRQEALGALLLFYWMLAAAVVWIRWMEREWRRPRMNAARGDEKYFAEDPRKILWLSSADSRDGVSAVRWSDGRNQRRLCLKMGGARGSPSVPFSKEVVMSFASIRNLLSRSVRRPSQGGRSRPRSGGPRFRPRIEILEDRLAPAVATWSNPAGGAWETPSNWSAGNLPGPADDVVIDTLNSGAVITHASDATSIHSLSSTISNPGTLNITGGSLTFAADSVLNSNTTVNLSGGFFQTFGGSGDLTLNGPFNWMGGTLNGTGTTTLNAAANTISGNATKFLDGRFLFFSSGTTTTWSGAGDISVSNGGLFFVGMGSTFLARTDSNQNISSGGGPLGLVFVDGTFRKDTSTGTVGIGLPLLMRSPGQMDLQTGMLTLNQGGFSQGPYTIAANATLNFAGGEDYLFAGTSVGGLGSVICSGGLVEMASDYNLTGPQSSTTISGGTMEFPGNVLNVGSSLTVSGGVANFLTNNISTTNATFSGGTLLGVGDVAVTGAMTWTNPGGFPTTLGDTGSVTVAAGATLTINGPGTKMLDSRTLNNNGTASWFGTGNIQLANGAILNNLAGATFQVQIDDAFSTTGALSVFNNVGTFVQLNSTGVTTIAAPFFNTGSVQVQTGTLILSQGGVSTGSFTVSPGATLNFAGGTHGLRAASSIAGDGTGAGAVIFSGGIVEVGGSYNLTGPQSSTTVSGATANFPGTVTSVGNALTVSNGTANFVRNNLSIPTVMLSGGTLLGIGDVTVTGAMTWTNPGGFPTTMGDTGSTTIAASAALNISGAGSKVLDRRQLNINPNATATWIGTGDLSLANAAVLVNRGTFNINNNRSFAASGVRGEIDNLGGTFRKAISTDVTTVNARFINDGGSVLIVTGSLVFTGGGDFASGSITLTAGANPATNLTFGGGNFRIRSGTSLTSTGIGANSVVVSSGIVDVLGTYNITGTTTVGSSGTLEFLATSGPATSGPLNNAGTVSIGTGTTLTVAGAYTQTGPFGRTNLNGATLTATNVNIQGGSLVASGTINGNVSNAGVLDIGSPFNPGDTPGTLIINGNYVQTASGTLDIKVGGTALGTFDQLQVSNNVTLAGTLNVKAIDGFDPRGKTFQIITFASHSGTFTTVSPGFTYDPTTGILMG
jgi:hypothetical protein